MSPEPDETNNLHAKRALQLGVITWLSNAAGCLIGMVPIALPLGVLLVGVTLITGAMAMVYGVLGKRTAARTGGDGACLRESRGDRRQHRAGRQPRAANERTDARCRRSRSGSCRHLAPRLRAVARARPVASRTMLTATA